MSAEIAKPETVPPVAGAGTAEAKSRFNAALEEAKAGASALGSEAKTRAEALKGEAQAKSESLAADAKAKASDLAVQGKAKASEALTGLSKVVADNSGTIDENFGPKYGDYARKASESIQQAADTLDRKSVEELGEDAREYVRNNPATAVGIAAVVGFLLSRLFRSK